MSTRIDVLMDLRRSVLGPRHGITEQLSEPHKEYITGVLAPVSDHELARDPDSEIDLLLGDGEGDPDEEEAQGPTFSPLGISPALDPTSQPSSMGLTFVINSDREPVLDICLTFARYERQPDGGLVSTRRPYQAIFRSVQAVDGWTRPAPGDVSLSLRCRQTSSGYRISIFARNLRAVQGTYSQSQDFVFQPQIRVALAEDLKMVSLINADHYPADNEENGLEMLFQKRAALARGHLCSAVWKQVDPERPKSDHSPSPFVWEDGALLPPEDYASFCCPDVRTEYVPAYPVLAPSPYWRSEYGQEPDLDTLRLSGYFEPDALRKALEPLAQAYRRWIEQLDTEELPASLRAAGERHLEDCQAACDRIAGAIDLLTDNANSDLRLAFCFANRAIYEQNAWRSQIRGQGSTPFRWHPFQLGFILLALEGVANPQSEDRLLCDLLWFPTGGGKTEAYLGLIAFALALRRLRADVDEQQHPLETGLGVISRYTLRLLTIQQFRRALGMITACEMLRLRPVNGRVGWRPEGSTERRDYLWGATRFSAGLWAGQRVTPNRLKSYGFPVVPGAIDILTGSPGTGEPAQILTCPCCGTHLALAQPKHPGQENQAFPPSSILELHLTVFSDRPIGQLQPSQLGAADIRVQSFNILPLESPDYFIISFVLESIGNGFSAREIDEWWRLTVLPALGGPVHSSLACARPSRPGYFIRTFDPPRAQREVPYDFDVFCPNPRCGLANTTWREKTPIPVQGPVDSRVQQSWQYIVEPFRSAADPTVGTRIPIPARTVDEQIYRHPPSLIVATVDKFARIAFEPEAAGLFGNIGGFERRLTASEQRYGFTRHPHANSDWKPLTWVIHPPDLVLQDELHLIDGPLGSMVGLYEAAIDALCEDRTAGIRRPKYVASTATVRQARDQVRSLFDRELAQFPPPGLDSDDSFFSLTREVHPAEHELVPGRIYVGIAAPGKGAQTPIVRIWASLLQAVETARQGGANNSELDPYWTLLGYFNAMRELAGAAGLFRQDIPQRIDYIAQNEGRPSRDVSREAIELSSRMDSLLLPSLLDRLDRSLISGEAENAALATSMFGTGVDVARLGLMVVHGQPKSTSSYIQASGRVGRSSGGIVVSFLRASRPRDLDHYEFFTGYHSQLYRSVEAVTVAPFSPRARDRGVGPICTALLRQANQVLGHHVDSAWPNAASLMGTNRNTPEVRALCELLETRARQQPAARRPLPNRTYQEAESELDRWRNLAQLHQTQLDYVEYAITNVPRNPVVLGDPQHQQNNLDVAFENAPQSLRELEASTGFKVD